MKNVKLLAICLLLSTYATYAIDTLTVAAVGDLMLGTAYPSTSFLPSGNNCSPLLRHVKPHLQQADVAFGNLEGVLTNELDGVKQCKNPEVCYAFAMPTHYARCLADAGFDLLSLANNHTGDFGLKGRRSTMRALDSVGLAYAGLETHPSVIIERAGHKIGFCAFAPNSGTCKLNNYKAAAALVKSLKSTCSIVVVSFHAGAEGSKMTRVNREREYYLGEDRGNVYEFARLMIDAGADLLLGHGPHVTRAVDVYKGRFIAYSMGNFCTYSRINLQGVNGLAPLLDIKITSEGQFVEARIIPTYQDKGHPVKIDPQHRVTREIQKLTRLDFPEAPLRIDDDGYITLKK